MKKTKLIKPQKKEKSLVAFYAGESCVCITCVTCVSCVTCVISPPPGGGDKGTGIAAAVATCVGSAAAVAAVDEE